MLSFPNIVVGKLTEFLFFCSGEELEMYGDNVSRVIWLLSTNERCVRLRML